MGDSTSCKVLKQNLIAIYQLQFQTDDNKDVVIGPNDDIMLQVCIGHGGTQRIRKCKWIQRDVNNGEEKEVDVKFKESRVGGMSEKDLVHYIHTEERMQQSDFEEERRQQIKNSLEENTFQFKDELSSTDDRVKEQKAWNECMKFVSDLENQIINDEDYEYLPTETYIRQLEAINEKFGSYRKWNEDYLKYLQNKKVPQQINNENNDDNKSSSNRDARRKFPKVAPNSACNSYDPFSTLFSQSFL